jgi:hypothetical protein
MKRLMTWTFSLLLALSVQGAQAGPDEDLRKGAVELTGTITQAHYDEVYKPVKDAADEAKDRMDLTDAADLYVRAAYRHTVPAIRAAMLRNAAFHLARAGKCERALKLWKRALNVLQNADYERFPGYKKSRAKTFADITWGLEESACRE